MDFAMSHANNILGAMEGGKALRPEGKEHYFACNLI
jgi:hypothetical protein